MKNLSARRWLRLRECFRLITHALRPSAAQRKGVWTHAAILAVSLPLCGNVPYGAVAKSGLIDPSSARAQFFPWTLPDGIPPIQNGFRNFGGGLMAACTLEIAIDLDRHIGYRITSCNDGAYDASEWAKAKAAADRSFDKEVKGTLFHVAVKSFQISTAEQQTLVCDANAMWKATPPQRNFAPTADSISNLTIRNNNDMRMEGAFTVYTPEGLVLKKEMEQLAGP